MKVLNAAGQIGLGNVIEEGRGDAVKAGNGNLIAWEWRAGTCQIGRGFIDGRDSSRQRTRRNNGLREIALTLGERGNGCKVVEPLMRSLHTVIDKKAGLIASIINLGD